MKPETRILIIGPSWVGDMVMAQSLFKVLIRRFPEATIDVLAPGWTLPLLERMPEVNDAIDMPLGHGKIGLGIRYRLGKNLRERSYDRTIVLPNSLKSALVPFWARIPLRTGFIGEMRYGLLNDPRRLDPAALPKTVQRFVSLGLEKEQPLPDQLPLPSLEISHDTAQAALARLNVESGEIPILGLCPGAEYGPAKRWPVDYYAEIAKAKQAEGWQTWVFGSTKDAEIGRQLTSLIGEGCTDLTGQTTLAEAIDLMSLVTLIVTNDSGLMHVAAALDRKLVAIYGSSDPGFTPPLHPNATVLRLGLECSPCFKRECPLGHLNCLNNLKPAQVLETCKSF
ncbi:MAG: lipopolysaccharide heptosyltransferase II [Gammaproteobacteria bacterium]|nr:lipopolysaccharide heptosyltransferase II [Gammaproteobacteria bacterium]